MSVGATSGSKYAARDFNSDAVFEESLKLKISDLCKLFGEPKTTIANLVSTGVIKKSAKFGTGYYDVLNSTKAYTSYLKSVIRDSRTKAANSKDDPAKKRWLKARASLMELQLAKASGKMIEVELVSFHLADMAVRVRQKLASIPTRAAPLLSVETDTATIQKILADMVYEACNEFTTDWEHLDRHESAGQIEASDDGIFEGDEATSEDDDQ